MRLRFYFLVLIFCLLFGAENNFAQTSLRTISIITEPNATVWLDDIKRGVTDENGKLTIKPVASGARKLRVRANGFKEISMTLAPARKGSVKVLLAKTTDGAELAFQQAESLTASDKPKAVELYKKATSLRPKYAEAHLGLARVLSETGDSESALKAVKEARKARPRFAEASAVEGRIYKSDNEEEKAITAFKRAVTEGKGFQPEAHTGLGLLYKEKAEGFGAAGDFANEKQTYLLAAKELKIAVAQLSGSPDAEVIYQLLGGVYEKLENYKEAINIYEEFLRAFPESNEASAVQSFIVQLKKQMSGEQ